MAKGRYQVEFKRSAEKAYAKLPADMKRRIASRLRTLEENPRPDGVKKLKGEEDLYRVREGDYRIIYTIEDRVLIVLVVAIGNRRDVYR